MNEIDKKVYERMQSYINDVEKILQLCRDEEDKLLIQGKYRILKSDIKDEYKFWDKVSNRRLATNLAKAFYIPAIRETSAFGFDARVNGEVTNIYKSLLEAKYKLTKYKSKDMWFEMK